MVAVPVVVEGLVEGKEVVVVVTTAWAQDQGRQQTVLPVPLVVVMVLFPSRAVPLRGSWLDLIAGV